VAGISLTNMEALGAAIGSPREKSFLNNDNSDDYGDNDDNNNSDTVDNDDNINNNSNR
jgi:hypothetical protein